MHSRDRVGGGWSAIVDPEEEGFGGEAEAKTDPQMSRSELKFPDHEKTTIDSLDPVTRAMLESDDEAPPARPLPKRAKIERSPPPPPQQKQPPPPATTPVKKLRLPMPGENRKSTSASSEAALPTPPPRVSMPSLPADPANAPPPAPSFSTNALVEKLSDGSGSSRTAKAGPSFWVEYKEVIRAAVIGVVLIAGVVAYQLNKGPEKMAMVPRSEQPVVTVEPEKTAPPKTDVQMQEPGEQPKPLPKEQPEVPSLAKDPKKDPTKEPPPKAATPMVTVVSTPPRATVEINGDVIGKTPLIMRSPTNIQELAITISLDGHKKWQQNVPANEAGHFTVNAKLEPK